MKNPDYLASSLTPSISAIVPTYNEARAIGTTLDILIKMPGILEVIVVDGGSLDATVAIARARGARRLYAARSRGIQMHAGAAVASGDILWFVHADTHPPADAARRIQEALGQSHTIGGCFAVRFDIMSRQARLLAWLYAGLRRLGLCYGDATLFLRRSEYELSGGFRPFPLFEDLDLVGRLRERGRFLCLTTEVIVSSRRFDGRSFCLTLVWWMALQLLYWLGVPPRLLGRMYAPIRSRPRRKDALPSQVKRAPAHIITAKASGS
jgi:rSAM/selenodomain-associated transferase 2